jgi:hypothetical protein
MAHREAVALAKDFGDAATIAGLPIGLIAQPTARRSLGDPGGLPQRELAPGTPALGPAVARGRAGARSVGSRTSINVATPAPPRVARTYFKSVFS